MISRPMVLVAVLAFGGVACGDDGPLNLNGTLSFNHSGAINGTFDASGRFNGDMGDFAGTEWAAGARYEPSGLVAVTALVPAPSAQRYHTVTVWIPRLTPGSATIDVNCTSVICAGVSMAFDASNTDNNASHFCFLTAGTVAIASISGNRASGTFSGTGGCSNALGVTQTFTVSNGAFDVPLFSDLPDP